MIEIPLVIPDAAKRRCGILPKARKGVIFEHCADYERFRVLPLGAPE